MSAPRDTTNLLIKRYLWNRTTYQEKCNIFSTRKVTNEAYKKASLSRLPQDVFIYHRCQKFEQDLIRKIIESVKNRSKLSSVKPSFSVLYKQGFYDDIIEQLYTEHEVLSWHGLV